MDGNAAFRRAMHIVSPVFLSYYLLPEAIGGGITPRGSERRIKLRRLEADGKTREYDASLVDVVKADDVIFVKEALF